MCNLCYFCFAFSFILTSFLTRLCCQCMPACALPIECLISHFIYCPGILTCWLTWKGIVKAVVFDITATAYTSVASKATYTLPHGSSWGRSLWEHAEFELFQHWWVRQTYLRTHKHCKGAHVWHFLFSAPELAAEISLNPVLVLSWPFKMFLVFLHHSLCNNRQVQVGTPARMKIFLFFFSFLYLSPHFSWRMTAWTQFEQSDVPVGLRSLPEASISFCGSLPDRCRACTNLLQVGTGDAVETSMFSVIGIKSERCYELSIYSGSTHLIVVCALFVSQLVHNERPG